MCYLDPLITRYTDVIFVGAKHGEELVSYFNAADVFVFPSPTDTFGLVMLEALACGTPVAAFPVIGPRDVITDSRIGCIDENLETAVAGALKLKREDCLEFAKQHTWTASATVFRSYLQEFNLDRYLK